MARTVLVADDSSTIQNRAQSILRAEGFVVETVSNGVAAIKKLPKVLPDVVLADISMPGKDGFEVCDFIKNSPEFRRVSVLLIANDMEPYDELHAKRVRADGKVMKPFNPQELVSLVSKFAALAQIAVPAPETGKVLMPGPSPDVVKTVATPESLAEALPREEELGVGREQKAGISPLPLKLTPIEEPESQPQSALPPEVTPAPARPEPSLDDTAFSFYTPPTAGEAGGREKPAAGSLEFPVAPTAETLPEAQAAPTATSEPASQDTDVAFDAASPPAGPAQAEAPAVGPLEPAPLAYTPDSTPEPEVPTAPAAEPGFEEMQAHLDSPPAAPELAPVEESVAESRQPAVAPSPSEDQSRLEEVIPEASRPPATQVAAEAARPESPLETPRPLETPPVSAEPIQVMEVAPSTLDQAPAAQEIAPQEPEASPAAEAGYTPPPIAAPPLDAELVFSIVRRTVEKMSPPALAPEMIDEITRKLCGEIRREFNLGPTP